MSIKKKIKHKLKQMGAAATLMSTLAAPVTATAYESNSSVIPNESMEQKLSAKPSANQDGSYRNLLQNISYERNLYAKSKPKSGKVEIPLSRFFKGNSNVKSSGERKGLGYLLKAGVGALGASFAHEGSHYLVAKAFGADDAKVGFGKCTYEGKLSDTGEIAFGLAGFAMNTGIAKAVIRNEKLRENPFGVGAALAGIGHNIYSGITGKSSPWNEGNDFVEMEKGGVNTDLVRALLVGHGAWSLYRLLKNPEVNDNINFYVAPTGNGKRKGICAGINYRF